MPLSLTSHGDKLAVRETSSTASLTATPDALLLSLTAQSSHPLPHNGHPLTQLPAPPTHTIHPHNTLTQFSPVSLPTLGELFVGNLSFFCEEARLHALFHDYGTVAEVRVVRNDNGTRSLMFGFVTMSSASEAREMVRLFDGHLFMGRNLKVQLSDRKQQRDNHSKGFQVHLSFCSNFETDSIVRPTELLLRKYFLRFGSIVDVAVREYVQHVPQDAPPRQDGYGFATFSEAASVLAATAQETHVVEGITVTCTITHHATKHTHTQPLSFAHTPHDALPHTRAYTYTQPAHTQSTHTQPTHTSPSTHFPSHPIHTHATRLTQYRTATHIQHASLPRTHSQHNLTPHTAFSHNRELYRSHHTVSSHNLLSHTLSHTDNFAISPTQPAHTTQHALTHRTHRIASAPQSLSVSHDRESLWRERSLSQSLSFSRSATDEEVPRGLRALSSSHSLSFCDERSL